MSETSIPPDNSEEPTQPQPSVGWSGVTPSWWAGDDTTESSAIPPSAPSDAAGPFDAAGPSGASDPSIWATPFGTAGPTSPSSPWERPAAPVPVSDPRRGWAAVGLMAVSALVTASLMSLIHWPANRSAGVTNAFNPTAPGFPNFGNGTNPFGNGSNPFGNGSNPFGNGSGSAANRGANSAPPADEQAIAAKVNPGIVDINTRLGFGQGAGAGTGMILDKQGDILTNNHVIDGATRISVTRVDNGRTYTAQVVGTDPTDDVAVLRVSGADNVSPIRIADSSNVNPGDTVFAIGNAGGVGGTPSVVSGIVQAVNQTITAGDAGGGNSETLNGLIQMNAPIQPGDSGGALVNSSGQVIGMNTAASAGRRFRVGAGIGFAIPINHATSIAKEILAGHAGGAIHIGLPGFLGVGMNDTGTSTITGATVTGVEAGSPADSAGIKAGDTITAIDSKAVGSASELMAAIRAHKAGDRVTVSWVDGNGASHRATVTLAQGAAD